MLLAVTKPGIEGLKNVAFGADVRFDVVKLGGRDDGEVITGIFSLGEVVLRAEVLLILAVVSS